MSKVFKWVSSEKHDGSVVVNWVCEMNGNRFSMGRMAKVKKDNGTGLRREKHWKPATSFFVISFGYVARALQAIFNFVFPLSNSIHCSHSFPSFVPPS